MTTRRPSLRRTLLLLAAGAGSAGMFGLLVLPAPALAAQAAGVAHLEWAHRLIDGVTPDTNLYASRPTVVTWAGVDGAGETRNRSVCSALVAQLMRRAYGYRAADFASWLGGRFPRAAGFHDAIAAGHGFDRVPRVADIRPGDVLAIKYPPGTRPTGHVLLAASRPERRRATPPELAGTEQWEISVIDSSHTGHGPNDTRHYAKGKYHSGVGEGTFRLYAAADGTLAGYSWSLQKSSEIYTPDERHLVVGRLNGSVRPTGGAAAETAAAADDSSDDDAPPAS